MQVTSLPSRIHVSRPFSPCSLRMLRSWSPRSLHPTRPEMSRCWDAMLGKLRAEHLSRHLSQVMLAYAHFWLVLALPLLQKICRFLFFHVSPRLVRLNQDPEKPSQQNEKISEDLTCCTLLLWRGSFLLLPWWFTTLWPMASREAWEKVNGKVEDHGNYIELHHKHP